MTIKKLRELASRRHTPNDKFSLASLEFVITFSKCADEIIDVLEAVDEYEGFLPTTENKHSSMATAGIKLKEALEKLRKKVSET